MPNMRGKRLTLIIACVAALVLAGATWGTWPRLVFWWRFEPIGLNAEGYPEYRHRQTGIVFVRLPGGTFWMGAQKDDPEGQNYDPHARPGEGPVHEVTLSPFLIAKYEVTQQDWHQVMGSYPSRFDGTEDVTGNAVDSPDNRDCLPIAGVSWNDIQEFEEKTGLALPTEAQWEYACRGGTDTAFSFGSAESCADWVCAPCLERDPYMWYCANSGNRPREIGAREMNPFGLHDIHGNAFEWCEDGSGENFYSTAGATLQDPVCASGSVFRVVRGGCWISRAEYCRSAYRRGNAPWSRHNYVGFRVAYWPLP